MSAQALPSGSQDTPPHLRVVQPVVEIRRSTAKAELPNQAAVARAGIELDLATARFVIVAVSRHLVLTSSLRLRNSHYTNVVYEAMRLVNPMLGERMELELPQGENGLVRGWQEPVLPYAKVHNGEWAQRRLGVGGYDLTNAWAQGISYSDSCLPLEIVLAHLPAPAWRHIAALLELEPQELLQRAEAAVELRRRSAGTEKLVCEVNCVWSLAWTPVAGRHSPG